MINNEIINIGSTEELNKDFLIEQIKKGNMQFELYKYIQDYLTEYHKNDMSIMNKESLEKDKNTLYKIVDKALNAWIFNLVMASNDITMS